MLVQLTSLDPIWSLFTVIGILTLFGKKKKGDKDHEETGESLTSMPTSAPNSPAAPLQAPPVPVSAPAPPSSPPPTSPPMNANASCYHASSAASSSSSFHETSCAYGAAGEGSAPAQVLSATLTGQARETCPGRSSEASDPSKSVSKL